MPDLVLSQRPRTCGAVFCGVLRKLPLSPQTGNDKQIWVLNRKCRVLFRPFPVRDLAIETNDGELLFKIKIEIKVLFNM